MQRIAAVYYLPPAGLYCVRSRNIAAGSTAAGSQRGLFLVCIWQHTLRDQERSVESFQPRSIYMRIHIDPTIIHHHATTIRENKAI